MLKLLKNLNKKEWLFVLISLFLIVVQVALELKMPDFMSEITKLVQTEGSEMGEILKNGAFMILCALGSLVSAIFVGYFVSSISSTFSMRVRKSLFDKVGNLSMAEVKKFSVSSLITRTTNDVSQVEMLIGMGLQVMVKAPITAIWAITKILNKSWQWSAATAIAVVVLISVLISIMVLVLPKFKKVQKLVDRLNEVTRENLTGIRVVRAFNAESYQEKKFGKANDDLTNLLMYNQKKFALMQPVMYLVMHSLALSVYFIGAVLINQAMLVDKLAIFGDMIVFSSYSMQVIMSFLMLAFIFMMLPRAQVSAKRINEVLDEIISIKSGTKKEGINGERGTVEFKNVSFRYADSEENLLQNISFKVNKGEQVAFIGSTGSGKSSLINLIPRLYDVTEGEVLVDGVNVKEYELEALNNKIGYVSQKAVIFDTSVKENIAYGDNGKGEPSEKAVLEAASVAQAKEFIENLEDKYESHIAEGGTNLSGGQKQRISIARAIAKSPEIYIFDDSFSALDYKTDLKLRKELKQYTNGATILIVAQRIGTIMNADKIIVLDSGKCVGIGTHKELLNSCEVYRQIALSQLSKEELENA